MKDVAVFGIGKLGKTFAVTYSKKGGKVFAIDRRQERVDGIAEDVTYAIRADVTEENVVENLGINNVDAVVVALGNNFEASIIVTTICKSIHCCFSDGQITGRCTDENWCGSCYFTGK